MDFATEALCVTGDITHALKAEGADASEAATGRGTPIIAFDTTAMTSKTNRSHPRAGDPCHTLTKGQHPPAIAVHGTQDPCVSDIGHALGRNSGQENAVMSSAQVRRLTPAECERLQGFKVGHTLIPWRTWQESQRKGTSYEAMLAERGMRLREPAGEDCPDGPRYRALGNSMAVPVIKWIGRRIRWALVAVGGDLPEGRGAA